MFNNFDLREYKFLLLELIDLFFYLDHIIFCAYQSKAYGQFYLFLISKRYHEGHSFLPLELFVINVKYLHKNIAFIQLYGLFSLTFQYLQAFLLMIFINYKFQCLVFYVYSVNSKSAIKMYFLLIFYQLYDFLTLIAIS